METAAWKSTEFSYPCWVPSMISDEEKKYLYWLTRENWSGQGYVVEIGPWLGGSTVCLAAGMRSSCHTAESMLQVYDNFIWRDFMSARAPLALQAGQSFFTHFRKFTREYADIIESHIRTLPDEDLQRDREARAKRYNANDAIPVFDGRMEHPVEILFIDGAKSWRGIRHLMRCLAQHLIPGKSLLVCQDFKYWGNYWVPLFIMSVRDYVEPVHNVLGSTTVTFRLTDELQSTQLESLPDHVADLQPSGALEDIEQAARILEDHGDPCGAFDVRLGRVSFLSHHGDDRAAVNAFKAIERDWSMDLPSLQLDRARTYLNAEKEAGLRMPLRFRATRTLRRLRSVATRA